MAIEERLVFNAHQVHGADHLRPTIKEIVHHNEADFGLMGMVMEYHNPDVRYDEGDENHDADYIGYRPPHPWTEFPAHERGDYIMIQSIERCANKATHYSLMLHELTHWAEVRTGWIHCMPVREFVAEMAMHVLGLELGIPYAIDRYNRTYWRVHWARIFNQDDTFFLWATSQVDRVVFYLLEPILHRGPNFYHDPWCVVPPVNKWSGPDAMSFDPLM